MRALGVVGFLAQVMLIPQSSIAQRDCIGRHTPTGMEFSGSSSIISEPLSVQEGAIFAESEMGAAGAITLMNAAGDTVLLRNEINPGPMTEANQVWTTGEYYLVVDFFTTGPTGGSASSNRRSRWCEGGRQLP